MNHVFTFHPEILDKTRVGGIIGVGGSGYDGWASLNLPLANIFLQHTRVLVDQMQINHCRLKEWNLWMQEGSPLTSNTHKVRIQDNDYETIWKLWKEDNDALDFRQKAYLRAKKLGRNVAEAMSLPINKVKVPRRGKARSHARSATRISFLFRKIYPTSGARYVLSAAL